MAATGVLIVGAGPTGLVLALRLARHGVPFRIVDKNSGPGQASRAMAVQARTLEFYQQLGLAREAVDLGIRMEAFHLRESGREIASVEFRNLGEGSSPFPFALCLPQDDHERFLVEKLEAAGVAVEWGVALKDLAEEGERVRTVLDKGGTEEVCEAAYLCGCDGAHSRVRQSLGLDFPGGTYDQPFFVADVRIAGDFRTDIVANLGSGGLALMLPVRSSGMQRLIGTVPEALGNRSDLGFEDLRSHLEPLLGVRVEQVNWFSIYHVHHRVAARFHVGRVFIAGDAAHIHSPAGGQGMNTGIGDAVNLSWKLANVIQGRAPSSILDTYESERIAFARTLVATTNRVFQGMVDRRRTGRFLRTWLMPRVVPLITRLAVVRRLIFGTVSQIRINYRDSALSEGRAGRVHGGDRLPWVPSGSGNFAPLTSVDWQIHVYGRVSPALRDTATMLGLPISDFAWSAAAHQAGLKQDAMYLLRPDGHVALASPDQDPDRLKRFMAVQGLAPDRRGEIQGGPEVQGAPSGSVVPPV